MAGSIASNTCKPEAERDILTAEAQQVLLQQLRYLERLEADARREAGRVRKLLGGLKHGDI